MRSARENRCATQALRRGEQWRKEVRTEALRVTQEKRDTARRRKDRYKRDRGKESKCVRV